MPNIKPVSDLRNYNDVLRDIAVGEPVFLTKNGRGRYAIIDIEEYEKTRAIIKLTGDLTQGLQSGKDNGRTTLDDVEKLWEWKRNYLQILFDNESFAKNFFD